MKRYICFFLVAAFVLASLLEGCGSSKTGGASLLSTHAPNVTASVSPAVTTPLAISSTPLPAPTTTPLRPCALDDPAMADVIVIGAILPLSNPGDYHAGFAMQAALNMALQDVNEHGGVHGHPIRVITYDSAGVPRRGALFAERLITLDCASVIVGLYHNNVASAVSDMASRYGVPLILAAPDADELTADQRRPIFRIAPSRTMVDRQLADWLRGLVAANPQMHMKDDELTVVIVAENRQSERDEVGHIALWLQQAGYAVAPVFVDLPTKDYSSVIARIVTLDMFPDVVVNKLNAEPALDFHQQLLQAGVGPQNGTIIVTGSHALDADAFWAAVPEGEKSVVWTNGPWSSSVTTMGREFAHDYEMQFGHWPEAYAFGAYDALRLAVDALNRATTLAFTDIVDTLESSNITLAAGRYTFPYGQSNPPADERTPDYLWHQWPDPPLLFLQYTAPQQPAQEMPVLWPPAYQTADGPYLP